MNRAGTAASATSTDSTGSAMTYRTPSCRSPQSAALARPAIRFVGIGRREIMNPATTSATALAQKPRARPPAAIDSPAMEGPMILARLYCAEFSAMAPPMTARSTIDETIA